MNAVISKPSKLAIAESFSKAAISYDQSAELQRRVGKTLLNKLPVDFQAKKILDLGCGTGYFTGLLKQRFTEDGIVGLDLAEGMLKQAKQSISSDHWIVGDAEQLPIKNNSLELIFSNLVLQWCHDFSTVLNEAHRVLKPKGVFLFTSLCTGTLNELQQSWQVVDSYVHVNSFISSEQYQQLFDNSDFIVQESQCIAEASYYPSLKTIMTDLKGVGAHNINPNRNKGLTTCKQLNKLINAYERFRSARGLPVTYQVIYSYLIKR